MSEIVQNQYSSWQAENSAKFIYNGYIYVGQVDTDPLIEANQVRVYYIDENEQEIDLAQPIRTNSSGFPVISETNSNVIQIRTDGDYSVKVLNKKGAQEWYIPKASSLSPFTSIEHNKTTDRGAVGAHDDIYKREIGSVSDMIALDLAEVEVRTKAYTTGTNYGGASYKIVSTVPAGVVIDDKINHNLSNGRYAIFSESTISMEQAGAPRGGDCHSALQAIIRSKINLQQKSVQEFTCSDVIEENLSIDQVYYDFGGCTITKTGSNQSWLVTTRDIERIQVSNLIVNGDNKITGAWRHRSFRQAFTGWAKFKNCTATNIMQTLSAGEVLAAAFFVEGGMQFSLFLNIDVDNVDAESGVASPVTRAILSRSIFELSSQNSRDFPLKTIIKNSTVKNIRQISDGDGVYGEVLDTSQDQELSLFIVEGCDFTSCDKRSIKSKYAINHFSKNTFRRFSTDTNPQEEVAIQGGGGSVKDNNIFYYRNVNRFLYVGNNNDLRMSNAVVSDNTLEINENATLGEFCRSGELIDQATKYNSISVINNEVTRSQAGSIGSWLINRPKSAPIGQVTTRSIVVENNKGPTITRFVGLDRGAALPDPNSFYGKIESVQVRNNVNTASAPVVDIEELTTNITYTAGRSGNININLPSREPRDYKFNVGDNGDNADTELNFDIALETNTIGYAEINCVAMSAGNNTRVSIKRGYIYISGTTVTEVGAFETVNDGFTGVFTLSMPDSQTLRVTKSAGSLANRLVGHVIVTTRSQFI